MGRSGGQGLIVQQKLFKLRFILKINFIIYLCVCSKGACTNVGRCLRTSEEGSEFLELEVQEVVSSLSQVLELISSPLQDQLGLSATEPPPQPLDLFLKPSS